MPHLMTGWAGALPSSSAAGPFLGAAPASPDPAGQQQMYWVQYGMPMMQPAVAQGHVPMQATSLLLSAHVPMPATVPSKALNSQAAPWVGTAGACGFGAGLVQGEVLEDHPAAEAVARGIPAEGHSETESISAAGKMLFGEALDGVGFDAISQDVGQPISGTQVGPMQSPGSDLHGSGNCNPCAWFWKPRGCASGAQCDYCHLCPDGELKRRKKLKIAEIKMGVREPVNPRVEARGSAKGSWG